MKVPSVEKTISYADLATDQSICIFTNSLGVDLAEMRWSGIEQQLYLKALYGDAREQTALQVTYDGKLSTSAVLHANINMPSAENYKSFVAGQVFYFKNEQEMSTDERYSINTNHAFLELDDCSLNTEQYRAGVSFDLRCDFHGVPEEGKGYVKIMLAIDEINNG